MKLSIIVPVYNMTGGGKLEYCLKSLLGQDLRDYEIIAVDDKSTDMSLAMLLEYEAKYPDKLRVLASPENRRQGGAKNLGLQEAKGEWIGFVDSDDWVATDMFSSLLQKAEQTGADVVGCDYLRTDETGKETGTPVINNVPEQTGFLEETKYKSLLMKPGSMVIKIYKRELFFDHALVFPEYMFYEDNAIGVLPLLYAKRFERVERCLYFYYQYEHSTVHTVTLERCRDRMRASKIYLEECRKRGFFEKYREEIEYKVFELGYRNTLFSYLQEVKKPDLAFIEEMKSFLQQLLPEVTQNPYYQELVDAENQKLIGMHRKNTRLFLTYYKLLYCYRAFRYGK